ncbi:MAG TPA: PAS-domain containing protein, partial [Amaricoccus sp.]|nr:PAS-domain containing protein [Amaricoccus sp.]
SHWFELSQTGSENGETFGFALAADDLVAAEASLRRFVETLTETFAHLPIGLAVFDKNRRLGLFNPALTDLVKIDAVWLAGRPSLRDFLERLRETRQMPEQKDFASWRRKLSELEEGARDGTYEEHWQLPSGKIFRVTGRPHPQGALAFLFEDISTSIILERRYRSELELSQATLDRMSEAVAVFDASGMLVFVNSAFEALWGLAPMEQLDGPGIAAMVAVWADRSAPSVAWARLAEFTTAAEARTSWTEAVALRDGGGVEMLVAPLPDASTLVVVRDRAEPGAPAATLDALAEIAGEGARADGATLAPLARALAGRGHPLDAEPGAWEGAARRAAIALGLAAAEAALPAARIALGRADGPGLCRLTVRTEVDAGRRRPEGPALGLARRSVAAAGGTLRLDETGGVLLATAEIPVHGAGTAAAGTRA